MNEDIAYDIRQLGVMKNLISNLKEGKIGFNKFIVDHWTLLGLLKVTSKSWKDQYLEVVNELELLYASALDRGEAKLNSSDARAVDLIISKLEQLIQNHKVELT